MSDASHLPRTDYQRILSTELSPITGNLENKIQELKIFFEEMIINHPILQKECYDQCWEPSNT